MNPHVLHRAVLMLLLPLLLLGPSPVATAAPGKGFDAGRLFPKDEILRVRVSPSGEWIVATAYSGKNAGVMAQRFGSRQVEILHVTKRGARSIDWVGPDTVLVRFGSGNRRYFLRVTFLATANGGFEVDSSTFRAWGHLVDSMPLVDGQLVWEIDHAGRNTVHRVSLDELMDSRKRGENVRRVVARLGERVAKIKGTSRRWLVDGEGVPLVAWRMDEDGNTLLYRDSESADFEEIHSHRFDDRNLLKPHGWSRDGRNLIVSAYHGKDTVGLFEYDPRTRQILREIYQRDDVDIDWVFVDPVTRDVLSVQYDLGSARKIHYLASSREEFAPKLGAKDPPIDAIRVVSSNEARDRFVYWTEGPTEPGAHYLRSVERDETVLVGQKGAKIDRAALLPLESFRVESTDGLTIEALLTLPAASAHAGHPLVVMPHGGPIGVFDRQAFDPVVQYFASWGFAVLQANFRGSGGYGDEFEKAGKREWARGIEDDIEAAIEATRARPDIDGSRLCIIGGSYGGFSAITSALRQPQRFRCAATINGVTDIPLLYESSDFADVRSVLDFYEEFVGNPETERDELLDLSPVYQLERLETPLLVVYGDSDRRVDPDHAHRLLALLRLYGKDYEEIRVKDGHHSFTGDQWSGVLPAVRRFLTRHLMPDRVHRKDPP